MGFWGSVSPDKTDKTINSGYEVPGGDSHGGILGMTGPVASELNLPSNPDGVKMKFSVLFDTKGISDVHIVVDESSPSARMYGWIRRGGILIRISEFVADDADMEKTVRDILEGKAMGNNGNDELSPRPDDSLTLESGIRLRISRRTILEGAMRQVFLRILPKSIPAVVHRLPDILSPVANPTSGIFLVSGVTGSGKSTLLASLAQNYLDTCGAHLVTIEDPIEYIFRSTQFGYASQRDVGKDVASFADGVKRSLREDPDVILVGEIRDQDTALAALTAAETGHMVLATVHAPGCFGAIDRYLAMLGSEDYQAMRFSHAYLGGIHIESMPGLGGGGGMTRTYEAFFNNDASRTHIRERKTHQLGQSRNVVLKKTLDD